MEEEPIVELLKPSKTDDINRGLPPTFGSLGDYREHMDDLVEKTNDEMVDSLKDNLDNLLIFVSVPSSKSYVY